MVRIILPFLCSLCFLLTLAPARAQHADVLTIALPAGGIHAHKETVISAESPSLRLETALILWKLDGKEVARGVGKVELPLLLRDVKNHELSVTVAESGGVTRTESLMVHASNIDIIWEAETLTPPLYRGRSLPSVESTVRAEAVVHSGTKNGSGDSPQIHIYTWRLSGKKIASASGAGKNALRFTIPTFENRASLDVSVQTMTGEFVGQQQVTISVVQPRVVFYEKRPLVGLWTNTSVGNNAHPSAPRTEGITISAFPYFLSARSQRDAALTYTWRLPKDTAQGLDTNKKELAASDVHILGAGSFSVDVETKQTLLQEVRGTGLLRTTVEGGESLFERK